MYGHFLCIRVRERKGFENKQSLTDIGMTPTEQFYKVTFAEKF